MIDAPIDGIQSKAYARWRGRRSNGFVMVLVVGFAALVMTTVTAYLALNSPALPMAMNQASAVRARYLAGSGIALATHYLAKPPTSVTVGHYWTGVTGFSIDASSDTVDVTVTRSATAQENYLVSATGTDLDASGAVRGKAAITTEIVTPPPPYFTLPQLFVSSSSIAIPDNLTFNGIVHANGNINCAAAVSGTVSATGTVAYSGGGSPTKTPSAAAIAMPTLSSVAWSRYVVNGVVRNATTFNSGNLTGANVASVGGNSSVTIVYQSDGSVAFLDTSGLTGLLGTLGNVVTSLTGITGAQHVAPSVITANNPGGVLVYNGNLTMPAGNAGLIGSLVVIGDLRIRDASNFCAMPGYPALVVTGDIRIDDNQKVEIDGPILYGGTFIGQKPGLTVNGPVRSYGAGFDKDFGKNINLVTRLAGIDIVFNASSTFQNYYDFSNTTPQPMTLLSWSEP